MVAMCGASLPWGPLPRDSQCRAAGIFEFEGLQLHHDPPLKPHERDQPSVVEDKHRVYFLCRACHAVATFEGR